MLRHDDIISVFSVLPLVSAREWEFPQATWTTCRPAGSGMGTRLQGEWFVSQKVLHFHCKYVNKFTLETKNLPWSEYVAQVIWKHPQLSILCGPPGEHASRCTHSHTVVLTTSHHHHITKPLHTTLHRMSGWDSHTETHVVRCSSYCLF